MYHRRPTNVSGRSRFLLALSLSTVTAAAVAAPLVFNAMQVDQGVRPVGGASTTMPTRDLVVRSGAELGGIVAVDEAIEAEEPIVPSTVDATAGSRVTTSTTTAPSSTTTTVAPATITTAEPTTVTTDDVSTTEAEVVGSDTTAVVTGSTDTVGTVAE